MCKKPFIHLERRDRIFCSQSCSTQYSNTGRRHSKKTKDKIRNSTRLAYKEGKKVYGGKTKWYTYNGIRVQGSYEYRTCFILDKMKELSLIDSWEYTTDRIQYFDLNNTVRTYLFDFKVFSKEGRVYYIETKGYLTNNDEVKWKSAKDKNIDLRIWFNETISEMERKLGLTY